MKAETHRIETLQGSEGRISIRAWPNGSARHVVVIAHGYGEHIGRYQHVARWLLSRGASVWGPDHMGHGLSAGERALVKSFEHVVDDLERVAGMARRAHPELPVVLIGHSMGGMIATRYAQRYGAALAGIVLSGPAVGRMEALAQMSALPEIPDVPIDPTVLSRDPAVQEAYARDPLVYHGPFKRQTLEAIQAVLAAIDDGPLFGDLPTLWLHGADDQLVPIAGVRAGLQQLRGSDFTERIYAGARHEVFNETNQDEVLNDVSSFIARVTRTTSV
jgi:alpha-beta hydrolase superfamily lysophospholipase